MFFDDGLFAFHRGAALGKTGVDDHGQHFGCQTDCDRQGEQKGGEPVALGQTDRDKDDGDEAIKRMSTPAIEFAPRSKPFLRQSGACMVPPETVS